MGFTRATNEEVQRMLCDVDGGPIFLMDNHALEIRCRSLYARKHPGATFTYGFGATSGDCKRTLQTSASFGGRRRLLECVYDPRTGDLTLDGSRFPDVEDR